MPRDDSYSLVLDATHCRAVCPRCQQALRDWQQNALDPPDEVIRATGREQVGTAVVRLSAAAAHVVVQQCIAHLDDLQVRSLLQELDAAVAGTLAVSPVLGASVHVVLPLPRPSGGWISFPRDERAVLSDLPTLDLSAAPVLVLSSGPLWASGLLDEIPERPELDDLLARMRARGYRLRLVPTVVVETEIGHVQGTAGAFPSEPQIMSDLRRQRLEQTLDRVQQAWRATAVHDLDTPRVLVDARGIKGFHNGTQQLAMALLDQYLPLNPRAHVLVSPEALDFHDLARRWHSQVVLAPDWEGRYDHAFRIDQPWSWSDVHLLDAAAPTISMYILDVIAWDTAPASDELRDVWASVATDADGLLFLSEASRTRFADAFPIRPTMCSSVLYPSLDPEEYRVAGVNVRERDIDVLVIGNGYPHKDLDWTVGFITAAFPEFAVETVGGSRSVVGSRTSSEVAELYARAQRVVYPSHYEGFGLPLLEALGYGATVIARDTAVNRELSAYLDREPWRSFRTGPELINALTSAPAGDVAAGTGSAWRWADAGRALDVFLRASMAEYDASRAARRSRAGASRA